MYPALISPERSKQMATIVEETVITQVLIPVEYDGETDWVVDENYHGGEWVEFYRDGVLVGVDRTPPEDVDYETPEWYGILARVERERLDAEDHAAVQAWWDEEERIERYIADYQENMAISNMDPADREYLELHWMYEDDYPWGNED
jgi:hypothetical protein